MDFSSFIIKQQFALRNDATVEEMTTYWEDCRKNDKYPFKALDLKPWNEAIEPLKPFKGIRVQLSDFEAATARRVGPERTKAARQSGAVNMIQDGEPDSPRERFIEQNGIAGELAFAKLFNIFPIGQLMVAARKAKDDDGDHTLVGRVVDVKTTEYPTGKLTLALWKNNETFFARIQVMSLMTGEIQGECRRGNGKRGSYVWHGFMSSRDLAKPTRIGSLPGRDGKEYIAKQEELTEKLDNWPC